MKTAIVYYSMSGNTKFVADKIAEKIGADVIRLEPVEAYPDKGIRKFFWGGKSAVMEEKPELMEYEFDTGQYDMIIFGTPVWASNFAPPLRTFIEENRSGLEGKKMATFVCFSGGGADKAIDRLKKCVGVEKLEGELVLVDPLMKVVAENEVRIGEFCEKVIEDIIKG